MVLIFMDNSFDFLLTATRMLKFASAVTRGAYVRVILNLKKKMKRSDEDTHDDLLRVWFNVAFHGRNN